MRKLINRLENEFIGGHSEITYATSSVKNDTVNYWICWTDGDVKVWVKSKEGWIY